MSKRQPSRSTVRLMPPTTASCFDHDHRVAGLGQLVGGGEPGRSAADDHHRAIAAVDSATGRRRGRSPCGDRSVDAVRVMALRRVLSMRVRSAVMIVGCSGDAGRRTSGRPTGVDTSGHPARSGAGTPSLRPRTGPGVGPARAQ